MSYANNGAGLVPMSDETRWHAIEQRYLQLGIKSIRQLTEATEAAGMGVSRSAIMKAKAGEGSEGTLTRLEAALNKIEHSMSSDAEDLREHQQSAPAEDQTVTFELRGVFGAEAVTVKGPISNLAELEAAVEKLLRGTGRNQE